MAAGRAMIEALSVHDPVRIGSYALLGRLGAGAMGRVYLGRSAAGRLVAVKTIRAEFAEDDDFRGRFAAEVAAARKVSGAFTAAVVTADADAAVPWLATTYVPAPSLDELVRVCGPLPAKAVRWLAAGCAEALESIHQAGLVHRDLKPSNVLISLDGPRVIDFGVARATERALRTSARQTVGTPAYMSPEQARDNQQVNLASDVFSLGSTLLFAATGHPPYRGEAITDVLVKLSTEPPDLSGLPDELTYLVTRCLAHNPDKRPTTADLLTELSVSGHEFALAPLPREAVALIEDYRRGVHPPAQRGPVTPPSEDDTLDSGPYEAYQGTPRPADPESSASAVAATTPGWRPGGQAIAITTLAAALLVGGGLIGAVIGRTTTHNNATQSGGQQSYLGVPPGADPPAPVGGQTDQPGGTPKIVVNQPLGDGNTIFVVHGTGYDPGKPVSVTLLGQPTSRDRPIADQRGTFNYAINQHHEFFSGKLPPGRYTVAVKASGEPQTQISFTVNGL